MTARMPWRGGWDSSAVAGNTTLTKKSGHWQKIDPNGAGRDVTLPAVTPQDDGDWFFIANAADAAEALTVKDAGGATIGTVSQSEAGIVYVDSAGAWQLFGVLTYAAS
ncbi:MAG: hypothetical protein ACTSWM_04850 [Alphaproteobacteria bacterium]